jgi:hypothetical protein
LTVVGITSHSAVSLRIIHMRESYKHASDGYEGVGRKLKSSQRYMVV